MVGLAPVLKYPYGFFNGAGAKSIGGAGIHLAISPLHYFCMKLACGLNTNTRDELLEALGY